MNVLLIACLLVFNTAVAFADDDDDKPSAKLPQKTSASGSVSLSAKAQTTSGVQTMTLTPVSHHPEFTAYGKAVNIQPLVDLRHRYRVALSEHGGATARFKQAEQNVQRQQSLYQEGAASKHNLQVQQAQWQTDKAQVDASSAQGKAVLDEARLNWGKELADWALTGNTDRLNGFLSGQKRLLQITLPANRQLPDDIRSIYVEAAGNRGSAGKAELISIAPQTDASVQGESYFFEADGSRIRTGMRVVAWIPEQDEGRDGVIIPKSAVVWYMDQAFVYIKTADEQFNRRAIDHYSTTAGGYFVGSGLNAGEQLVTTGGQMLLSEELRGQIPDQDD
ncbi:MAG: efflux RND transporter periplasmic adaptor subunit [Methylobacter sp.]